MDSFASAVLKFFAGIFVWSHPSAAPPAAYTISLNSQGGFTFSSDGQNFNTRTRLSLPGGAWVDSATAKTISGNKVTWNAGPLRITRVVSSTTERIDVLDEITNPSSSLAGLMIQNSVKGSSTPDEVRVSGVTYTADRQRYDPANPSVFVTYGGNGLGVVASDDVLRAQGLVAYTAADGLRLLDNSLAVQPGKTIKMMWSIYPSSNNYWDFVNQVRRDWNANFTLDGPFSYEPGTFANYEGRAPKEAAFYGAWSKERGLKYVVNSHTRQENGVVAFGSAIPKATKSYNSILSWMGKLKESDSNVKPLYYYHSQINTEPDADQKFADAKAYNAKGEELVYKNEQHWPLFIPTPDNSYGPVVKDTVTKLINAPQTGGIYWDEMSISYPEQTLSGFAYGDTWDGISAQINVKTHEIEKKKANVALAQQSIQVELVKKIRAAGKSIIANTQPFTRTMMDLHFPRYVEGKGANAISGTNLGVPLVLANMKPEVTPADAMSNAVEIFNQGAIYFGWVERYTPNKPDFNQLIFPITPVDLRPGVITGKERIITTKSGTFGFADASPVTIYVFDDQAVGKTVNVSPSGGKYKVTVPTGGLAIIIKK